eukprot:m.98748 g.98748  ORF g.98748 m.98748 type:complete len:571 (-) comp15294_c0_seq1:98-1810(-)
MSFAVPLLPVKKGKAVAKTAGPSAEKHGATGSDGFVPPGPVARKRPPPSEGGGDDKPAAASSAAPANRDEQKADEQKGEPEPNTKRRRSDPSEAPPVPYKPPSWSSLPSCQLFLEVLKGGSIVETIDISKQEQFVAGRLPMCDIPMEHPSISRYHAVLQHGDDGYLYVYDLGSTHGTKVNKARIKPKTFVKFRVGQMLRFGASSRLYVLQGDEEALRQEELRMLDDEDRFRVAQERQAEKAREQEEREAEGVSWGMREDAVDEDVGSERRDDGDASAMTLALQAMAGNQNEQGSSFWQADPKKALREYFEREGMQLEFDVNETGPGHARVHNATVRLHMLDGEEVVIDASVTGRKKEAVAQCAAKACEFLDKRGMLRQHSATLRRKLNDVKRKKRNDDDEDDTFFDRTGDVEKKKKRKGKQAVQTHEGLVAQRDKLVTDIERLEKEAKEAESISSDPYDEDDVDAVMKAMESEAKRGQAKGLWHKAKQLRQEVAEVEKLIGLVKPAFEMPKATAEDLIAAAKAVTAKMQAPKDKDTSRYRPQERKIIPLPPPKQQENIVEEEEEEEKEQQ